MRLLVATLLLIVFPLFAAEKNEFVTVYAYDAFCAKGGLGELVASETKKRLGIETRLVPFPNAGEALNQVALEGKATRADLVVGIDGNLEGRAKATGHFTPLRVEFPTEVEVDTEKWFVPFDYGYLAFIYDKRRTHPKEGLSLREFSKQSAYAKKTVMPDPRTSSLGLGFLVWTRTLFPGEEWRSFWKDFSKQLRTMTPGWTGAYGLFLKKEAEFVLSYTTSPAYHIENEKSDAFAAVVFPEGHYRQVEGVGLVKHSSKVSLAKKWAEWLVGPEMQAALPTRQWMYPARKGTALPGSFTKLPPAPKAIVVNAAEVSKARTQWLKEWKQVISQ